MKVVDADVLKPDGIEHPPRGLDDSRRWVALSRTHRHRLHDDGSECVQIEQGSQLRSVTTTDGVGIHRALQSAGHDSKIFELDPDLGAKLLQFDPGAVFPIAHGPVGEDGGLQGALEVLGLPYVGAGVLASATAAYKPAAKAIFRAAGLSVPDEFLVRRGDSTTGAPQAIRKSLGDTIVHGTP